MQGGGSGALIRSLLTTALLPAATLVTLATMFCMLATASPASAESPWWHLTTGSRPTYIQPGTARDEQEELVITGGAVVLLSAGANPENEEFIEKGEFVEINTTMSEAEVQSELEKLYGAGNVHVSGAAGTFQVSFAGALRDQSATLQPWHPEEATVVEKVKGRPDGEIYLTAENLGDANIDASKSPVRLSDTLPPGLEAVALAGSKPSPEADFEEKVALPCDLNTLTCTLTEALAPFDQIEMRIAVVVSGASSGEQNVGSISGGGAPDATVNHPLTINGAPTPFGVEDYELVNEEPGGAAETQAGSHPFQQTTTITLNQDADVFPLENSKAKPEVSPAGLAKDLSFKWPPGLIGNPSVFPRCTTAQFFKTFEPFQNACPPQSAVGVAVVTVHEPATVGTANVTVPLFNLEPRDGEPARFGFYVVAANAPAFIDTAVRTGSDYGVTVSSDNITQIAGFISAQVTVWGVPGDPRHAGQRGWGCLLRARGVSETSEDPLPCPADEEQHPAAFLSMPTSCTGPMQTSVEGDSWLNPGPLRELAAFTMPALGGCNRLPFSPSIVVKPDTSAASSPSGLTVDVHNPQEETLNAGGLAEADPRNITVALPEGVAVNPSGGDGLLACSEGMAGFTGLSESITPGAKTATFTERLPNPLAQGLNFCPDAAKIGTVEIKTPILPNPIVGSVYLASQNSNPFGSLVAMYVIAEDPVSGVLVKLAGQVHLTEAGQLVTTFENSPQAPFEDAIFHFFGGERAPLATPAHCGSYTTHSVMTAWSGTPASEPASTFNITSGPYGTPCPGASLPFSPSLTGGTTNINAGSFSPLSTTISRGDGQQNIQTVQLHMPAGLEGLLTGIVPLCAEAQANEGTCGPQSLIGETTVSAGVGGDPVSVKGGRVYLTEKYAGGAFGLSIVNPVKAGPFDLEHDTSNPSQQPPCDCVVVRARIEVDPRTAELTITTDSSGPHAIPHLIDGIPVQIKKVNVLINRPGFTFNPTSCSPMSLTGTIGAVEGAVSPVSVPFQATNCANLKFSPKITVTTAAKTSKANGSSLVFKIGYPNGAMGSQSWFNEAKFDLPKQLPARLTTIQKACLASVFDSNPAACPPASLIGHAVVHTQVLPVPLAGPVYFVSHGGAKFPDAVLVLQGYGVKVNLVGETFINGKTNVTSATFRNTPDVPFESIEVTVPAGPFSEFGSNLPASAHGSFCGQKLVMPTLFKAQNGLEVHQNTPVGVSGCAKAKTRAQLLTAALKACHKRHSKSKRKACEKQARKRYGPVKAKKAKKATTERRAK